MVWIKKKKSSPLFSIFFPCHATYSSKKLFFNFFIYSRECELIPFNYIKKIGKLRADCGNFSAHSPFSWIAHNNESHPFLIISSSFAELSKSNTKFCFVLNSSPAGFDFSAKENFPKPNFFFKKGWNFRGWVSREIWQRRILLSMKTGTKRVQ